MPKKIWGDCLLTATYLINRLPSRILNNKSPYQILFEKVPDYSHLRPFGCLYFASNLSRNRDKLYPRAILGVLLGYPFAKKGYKILNLQANQVFVSRDVKFFESIFPFSYSTPMSKLFPASFPISNEILPIFSSSQKFVSPNLMTPVLTSLSSPNPRISGSLIGTLYIPRVDSHPAEGLCKSTREHNAPKYLSDYICGDAYSVFSPNPPLTHFQSYYFSALLQTNQHLVNTICQIFKQNSY